MSPDADGLSITSYKEERTESKQGNRVLCLSISKIALRRFVIINLYKLESIELRLAKVACQGGVVVSHRIKLELSGRQEKHCFFHEKSKFLNGNIRYYVLISEF